MPVPRASSAEKISRMDRLRLAIALVQLAWTDALEADHQTEVSNRILLCGICIIEAIRDDYWEQAVWQSDATGAARSKSPA